MRTSPTSSTKLAAASARSKLGLVSFAILAVLAATQLGASCVDGVTPDCSQDPTVCAPSVGLQSGGPDGSVTVPEASSNGDAANQTDAADAGNDLDAADADGG